MAADQTHAEQLLALIHEAATLPQPTDVAWPAHDELTANRLIAIRYASMPGRDPADAAAQLRERIAELPVTYPVREES